MKEENSGGGVIWLVFVGTLFIASSFMLGGLETWAKRDTTLTFGAPKSGCEYKSFASRYNPFYVAACELFRDRTLTD